MPAIAKMPEKPFEVGIPVFLKEDSYARVAKIIAVKLRWRTGTMREELLYAVRFFDDKTGVIKVCPDSRCDGSRDADVPGCVICGRNVWHDQIKPLTKDEIEFFYEYGILKKEE